MLERASPEIACDMHSPARLTIAACVLFALLLAACAGPGRVQVPSPPGPAAGRVPPTQKPYVIYGKTYYPLPSAEGYAEEGTASWYGKPFHGRKCASGETYDMNSLTAAHRTLPMNTLLQVQNLDNGRETVVRINDRGPFVKGRIIDLSHETAQALGMVRSGLARVRLVALGEAVSQQQGKESVQQFLPHEDLRKGDFYVQVGSFAERVNADRLQKKLLSYGRDAVIEPFQRGDAAFYRVQVAAGTTLDEAKRAERVWSESGYPGAFVIAK